MFFVHIVSCGVSPYGETKLTSKNTETHTHIYTYYVVFKKINTPANNSSVKELFEFKSKANPSTPLPSILFALPRHNLTKVRKKNTSLGERKV